MGLVEEICRSIWNDAVGRVDVAQNIAGEFFDEIGVGDLWCQQRDIALELGAHGLKALDLKLQQIGAFDQLIASLEAVVAMQCMINEIGSGTQAGKQHQYLA